MTITFPIHHPAAPGFNSFTFRRVPVVAVSRSPYTGQQKTYVHPGQWWEADVGLPDMTRAQAGAWRGFFGKLNGQEGTFLLGDPTAALPRGAASAAILLDQSGDPLLDQNGDYIESAALAVDGVHAARSLTLALKGAAAGVSGWLLAGDYIQIGSGASSRLHLNLIDADTDGSGKTTLTLWPRLRAALSGDESAHVCNCRGVFRLAENATGDDARPFPFFSMNFKVIEAL